MYNHHQSINLQSMDMQINKYSQSSIPFIPPPECSGQQPLRLPDVGEVRRRRAQQSVDEGKLLVGVDAGEGGQVHEEGLVVVMASDLYQHENDCRKDVPFSHHIRNKQTHACGNTRHVKHVTYLDTYRGVRSAGAAELERAVVQVVAAKAPWVVSSV